MFNTTHRGLYPVVLFILCLRALCPQLTYSSTDDLLLFRTKNTPQLAADWQKSLQTAHGQGDETARRTAVTIVEEFERRAYDVLYAQYCGKMHVHYPQPNTTTDEDALENWQNVLDAALSTARKKAEAEAKSMGLAFSLDLLGKVKPTSRKSSADATHPDNLSQIPLRLSAFSLASHDSEASDTVDPPLDLSTAITAIQRAKEQLLNL